MTGELVQKSAMKTSCHLNPSSLIDIKKILNSKFLNFMENSFDF